MGMYTGLRFKAIIKKEYTSAIKQLNEENLDWEEMKLLFPNLEPLTLMSGYNRADFIPYGGVAFPEWEIKDETTRMGYRTPREWIHTFDEESRIWTFQCSLKNYEGTIQFFLKNVASQIIDSEIHIEKLYEEDRYSTFYKLENGILTPDEERKMDYRPWQDGELYY